MLASRFAAVAALSLLVGAPATAQSGTDDCPLQPRLRAQCHPAARRTAGHADLRQPVRQGPRLHRPLLLRQLAHPVWPGARRRGRNGPRPEPDRAADPPRRPLQGPLQPLLPQAAGHERHHHRCLASPSPHRGRGVGVRGRCRKPRRLRDILLAANRRSLGISRQQPRRSQGSTAHRRTRHTKGSVGRNATALAAAGRRLLLLGIELPDALQRLHQPQGDEGD